MRAREFANSKLVIFDIDDTLVNTDTKVGVVRDGRTIKKLDSHDFTHYKLQPGEEFDFGAFRDAREFFANARPIAPMIQQLKNDIATGNRVIMVTARADFNDRDIFLDTFRKWGIDMSKVHVYRAGNIQMKVATEEKKKIILRHLLGKTHYDKVIMYDDAVPNLDAFLSLAQDYPWSRFYAWHVDREDGATEYHRSGAGIKENFADGKVKEMAPPPISVKSATLYHGTPTLNNAQGIIRNGLKFDPELIAQKYQGSENFAPLPGVYLSKDFGNAVRYSFMSEVPDEQYAEYIKQEPYGYVFEFSGQDLSQTSPDEDELGGLLEKFVKAKNPPPKLSALIQSIPENLKSQLSQPDVSFETIAVAGKWLVSKLAPQTLQYLMQRYINVVNYGILKPVAVWKIPKPEQRFLRDRQGTFDTHNGYINWANRFGKKQPLEENFADGKVKGKSRPGRVKRAGASCKGSVSDLRARAKKYGGERGKMYHWCANMKSGRKNK